MEKQKPHLDHNPSPGGGETPHPRTGPDQGGSWIDTAANNEQGDEGNKNEIEETVKQAAESDVKHQERHEAGQSLTAGDQNSGQAPAEGEQRPSCTVPDHGDRDATKPREPMDNSMTPAVEDPATGNASLKRPPGLTQIAEFWKRDDRLADIEDQKMSKNLNANLDVLLIFAALFSAINTAFISMTMPSLSPDPVDRTNTLLELLVKRVDNNTLTPSDLTPPFSPQSSSIAINVLLYASLCCSLLAAMGAMLGKEWLQSFDRSGQTGPLEDQGRFRQRKFNGILQWHLEGTILFLPNLLLFSVTLFFAGLALYLFPINKVVAGLLIAVLSFSVGVWLVTVLAGAIWPLCPYQSAASRAVRLVGLRATSYWVQVRLPGWLKAIIWPITKATARARVVLMRWKTSFLQVLRLRPSSTATQITQTRKEEIGNELRAKEEQISNAQAAFWLIKTTSSWEDRAAAAEFITTFDKILGYASVLQDQGNWQGLLQSTQEAFENWHYQPSSANRKILESFGRAFSDVGLLRLENRSLGQLRGVSEHFLYGLGTASRRMNDKDTDRELLTYAASLYALKATGNIYTKSRSWERLFVLMGDFDFNLLHRRVTFAFWSAAHTLRALPGSHPETSAFEVYSTFLQEIQHITTTEQLPGELVSLLTYSAVEFIFDFNESFGTNPVSPNFKLDKFSAEALLSLRAILPCWSLPTSSVQARYRKLRGRTSWGSPKRTWDSPKQEWWGVTFDHFWRALDSIITKLTESPPEIKELTVDFVLAAVEWLSISLPSDDLMYGLESFPQIPTFIALSLVEGDPARQARGLDLFFFNLKRWILLSPRSLDWVWVEVGLVARLVGMVKEPQIWSNGTRLLEVFNSMTNGDPYWSHRFVGAGFISAATKAIIHINKTKERLHPEWEDLLRRTLAITLKVWDNTRDFNPSEWAASDMFLMVRHSSVHVKVSLNFKEEDPRDVKRFVELINHLYEWRSLAAFISCNADVAVRSLFCELRRRVEGGTHPRSNAGGDASASPDTDVDDDLRWAYETSQKIDWNYVLYGLPEAPVLCSSPYFVGTHWQML